jgi:CRISPR-associated protein Cmr4
MYNHKVYIIEPLTNTHVGSGDTNFGVVDNLIQKDPVTFLPVFHSSSIKGAIKEHMEDYHKVSPLVIPKSPDFDLIFGEGENKPGVVKFYDARLLTLPLRASKQVYYHCTSPDVILDYLNALTTFGAVPEDKLKGLDDLKKFIADLNCSDKEFIVFNNNAALEIEDYDKYEPHPIDDTLKGLIKNHIGIDSDNLAVFKDEIFSDICRDSLPVIARNKIGDDGISENLFYEEILPRRAKLWFMLGFDEKNPVNGKFEEKLLSDLIQIGGNASIGYGVTSIKEVKK